MNWLWLVGVAAGAILGIDYGTEFTKAIVVAPNTPFEIVLTPDSGRKDASGILLKPTRDAPDGSFERVYGSAGLSGSVRYPESALYATKMLLGIAADELLVTLFSELHDGVNIVSHPNRSTVEFKVGETIFPVEQVTGMALAELRTRATQMVRARALNNAAQAQQAAITVPGFWGQRQRRALRDAAALGGLDVVSLVDDGVAVAVNYATSRSAPEEPSIVAIYDMGAGSTTCTLVEISTDYLSVVGFGSESLLGGRALTALLRELLISRATESGIKEAHIRTPRTLARLWREAERAKIVLSANQDVQVHIESIVGDHDLTTKVTRAEFEEGAHKHVMEVTKPLEASLELFNGTTLDVSAVDAVLLVGGASRTPFVHDGLRGLLGQDKLAKSVNADEAAASGAALRGVALSGAFRSRPLNITERLPLGYKLRVDGSEDDIFARGSIIPSKRTVQLPVTASKLELVEVHGGNEQAVAWWDLTNTADALTSLEDPGPLKCTSAGLVNATFELGNDRIVDLIGAEAWCNAQGVNSSLITTKTRKVIGKRVPGPQGVPKSIDVPERLTLLADLRAMDAADADRVRRGELHNSLESILYRLRELVPAAEPLLHELSELVETGRGTISELEERLNEALRVHASASESQNENSSSGDEEEYNSEEEGHSEL